MAGASGPEVEELLQQALEMEGRVSRMQNERIALEQRVLAAQQKQARALQASRLAPEDSEAALLEKLKKQNHATEGQIKATEEEITELMETDPRAALVAKLEDKVDNYVRESSRLRRVLAERQGAVQGARPQQGVGELELKHLRAQVQAAQSEIAALREQTDALLLEESNLGHQEVELKRLLRSYAWPTPARQRAVLTAMHAPMTRVGRSRRWWPTEREASRTIPWRRSRS